MKRLLLFLIPLSITTLVVVGYFMLTRKVANISLPTLPTVSFSDLVKLSKFSLEKAPSQSLIGVLTSMSGKVEYESRVATEAAVLTSPVEVQQGESLSTGEDGSFILTFKDAAELTVSQNSGVDVIQTLPADLVFRQTLGSVSYKKLTTYPVSIRVGHLVVEDDGEIIISFTADSPITTITIVDGSATIAYNNLKNSSQVIHVTTGKVVKFNESNRQVVVK